MYAKNATTINHQIGNSGSAIKNASLDGWKIKRSKKKVSSARIVMGPDLHSVLKTMAPAKHAMGPKE